jgi:hypothetical protein
MEWEDFDDSGSFKIQVKKFLKSFDLAKDDWAVISVKKFQAISEKCYLPYSVEYHRSKGAEIARKFESFAFSVAPIEKSNLRKLRKQMKKKPKTNCHVFCENRAGGPDVHKLVKNSKGNIPLFLDQKERRYLRNHEDDLYEKFLDLKTKCSETKKVTEIIPTPAPPKEHRNWIVCCIVYSNFYDHIESDLHIRNAKSSSYHDTYNVIDDLLNELNQELKARRDMIKSQFKNQNEGSTENSFKNASNSSNVNNYFDSSGDYAFDAISNEEVKSKNNLNKSDNQVIVIDSPSQHRDWCDSAKFEQVDIVTISKWFHPESRVNLRSKLEKQRDKRLKTSEDTEEVLHQRLEYNMKGHKEEIDLLKPSSEEVISVSSEGLSKHSKIGFKISFDKDKNEQNIQSENGSSCLSIGVNLNKVSKSS